MGFDNIVSKISATCGQWVGRGPGGIGAEAVPVSPGVAQYAGTPDPVIDRILKASEQYRDYEFAGEIGEGGMSHVYLARKPSDGAQVALKVLKNEALPDPEKMARLARRSEGEIATALRHENVVQTYEYGKCGEHCYIVMEYIDGPNLRNAVLEGAMPERQKMDVTVQVGRGLEHIHSRGLVHRDICPKNILLTRDGTAKIIDFGLSIVEKQKQRHLWERSGTPSYMAPEQIRGNPGDCRADIYAFGLSAYEILTGRRPFEGRSRRTKMQGHLNAAVPPPTQFNKNIPPGVEEVIMASLAKTPDQRPQSMTAVVNKLTLAARKATEMAAVPATPRHLRRRRWSRGDIHRALAKADLAAAAVGVVSGCVVWAIYFA